MRKIIHQAISHPLISGSTVTIIGSLAANVINYFANLAAVRLLIPHPSDYGIFASLISIVNILSVFSLTISTVFTKFSAMFVGQKKENLIGALLIKGNIWVSVISIFISGIIIIFSAPIAHFLNIQDTGLVIITSMVLFFSFLSAVPIGVLQGLLRFTYFSIVNAFSSLIKLILIIVLLMLGLRVLGAINAFLISALVACVLLFFPLFKYFKKIRNVNISIENFYNRLSAYALPVFLSTIGMTMFISIDIILVKHFFQAQIASQYSALSLMGRSIFYVVQPVTFVLFPLIAQKRERQEKLTGTLLLSLLLMGLPSLILSIVYFLFPRLVISIFVPAREYASLAPYLGPFSLFILFYILSFLFNVFYLAIGKVKVFFLTIGAAILEIILIVIFHQSISQVIGSLIVSSFLLLFSLLLYYQHATKAS